MWSRSRSTPNILCTDVTEYIKEPTDQSLLADSGTRVCCRLSSQGSLPPCKLLKSQPQGTWYKPPDTCCGRSLFQSWSPPPVCTAGGWGPGTSVVHHCRLEARSGCRLVVPTLTGVTLSVPPSGTHHVVVHRVSSAGVGSLALRLGHHLQADLLQDCGPGAVHTGPPPACGHCDLTS